MPVPPLAGICSYAEAAQPGLSVDESVARLVRYAWLEQAAMQVSLEWLNPTPEWEVKEALSLHLYLDCEHAGALRQRIGELRNPPPRMDVSPSGTLDQFLRDLRAAANTLERLVGLYRVLKTQLLDAYRQHRKESNPVVAHPTTRILWLLIAEEEEAVAWGEQAIAALSTEQETADHARKWEQLLQAAGGIGGADPLPDTAPSPRITVEQPPDYEPRRDERFTMRWNFLFPPHEVYTNPRVSAGERTLALMCKRALEMDVPEAMARMIREARGRPWQYYSDMCRQLWDEARHAMMGTIYFESIGVDWRSQIALHPGFSLRLNLDLTALEAHTVLFAIEQGLMPAKTGKRYEWLTTREAEDPLAVLFQDYDWADEVLHAQIGRRWLLPELQQTPAEALRSGERIMQSSFHTLDRFQDRGEQHNWWPGFVLAILGRPSALRDFSDPVITSG